MDYKDQIERDRGSEFCQWKVFIALNLYMADLFVYILELLLCKPALYHYDMCLLIVCLLKMFVSCNF